MRDIKIDSVVSATIRRPIHLAQHHDGSWWFNSLADGIDAQALVAWITGPRGRAELSMRGIRIDDGGQMPPAERRLPLENRHQRIMVAAEIVCCPGNRVYSCDLDCPEYVTFAPVLTTKTAIEAHASNSVARLGEFGLFATASTPLEVAGGWRITITVLVGKE